MQRIKRKALELLRLCGTLATTQRKHKEQHKMTKTDYNGWTNRETWVINLWMGDYFQEVANDGEHLLADYIEETVWDMLEEAEVPPMFKDLIDLGVVNWQELAEHYVTDEEVA